MNKEDLQKQITRLGREMGEWLSELGEDELKDIEGRFEQLVEKLQAQYGWTAERAKREITGYLDEYSGRTQEIVDRTLDTLNARLHSRHKRKSGGAGPWLWLAFGVGVFVLAWQFIQPNDGQF
jgi:hypothetical protein